MHPNSMKRTKTWGKGPKGWIGRVRCEKFRHDFMARTFAPLRPVLHWVLYGNQTVPNFCVATKPSQMQPNSTKTQQNMSLQSHGVYRVRSLWKIPTRHRGTNFCTSLARFELSVVTQQTIPNASKKYEMQQNMRLESNGADQMVCCKKFRHYYMTQTFAPLQLVLHRVL